MSGSTTTDYIKRLDIKTKCILQLTYDILITETASNTDAVSVVDDTTSQVDSLMESDTIGNVLVDPSKGNEKQFIKRSFSWTSLKSKTLYKFGCDHSI